MRIKLKILACALLLAVAVGAGAQQIVTADRFMENLSSRYAEINDYAALITIVSGSSTMYGSLIYLNPYFLRIDFTTPAEQVIVFDGRVLTVYLPEYRAVLSQNAPTSGASIATAQGLSLLRRNYVAAFVSGPEPTALDTGEMAVSIRLTRRTASEGFREIILSVDPLTMLIRRVEGRTTAGALVRFDFSGIQLNLGTPALRFVYDSPASANVYNDFLYSETE
ncbi:MAG: outer-membrane lipoprotein carrier protein LolA [Treponema sp.]|jgi:outer membrane lipoprotein-sorting protein|nr:outer-membrane lipoprotein carrier protein LolA [Treponema sp.]